MTHFFSALIAGSIVTLSVWAGPWAIQISCDFTYLIHLPAPQICEATK